MPQTTPSHEFIRGQGLSVPVDTVISRGKEKDLVISKKQVYQVRGHMRSKMKKNKERQPKKENGAALPSLTSAIGILKKGSVGQKTKPHSDVIRVSKLNPNVIRLLEQVAAVIGISQSIAILQQLEVRIQRIIEG